jgi:hypothetical protein
MYVLTKQLHAEGNPSLPFRRYKKYLERNKERFPVSAFRFATGPLLDASDRRCLHDAWLEWARFDEPAKGKRRHLRHLRLNKAGNLLHEIEWAGPPGAHATWLIETSDVRLRSLPLGEA